AEDGIRDKLVTGVQTCALPISFGGEEEGLIGSSYYVANPARPLEQTVAMINMDMVGRLRDDALTIGGVGTASEWREWVRKANEEIGRASCRERGESVEGGV